MTRKEYTDRGDHWFNDDKQLVYDLTAQEILRMLRGRSGTVLDLGCGYGHIPYAIAQNNKLTVIGTDFDPAFIKVAKKQFKKKNLQYKVQDAYKLGKKKYDMIISTGYLCVGSFPGVKEKLASILKDDGCIVLDFRRDYDLYSLVTGVTWTRYKDWKKGEWYQFGWLGLEEGLKKAGLRVVEKKRIYVSPPLLPLKLRRFFEVFSPLVGWLLARVYVVKAVPIESS